MAPENKILEGGGNNHDQMWLRQNKTHNNKN